MTGADGFVSIVVSGFHSGGSWQIILAGFSSWFLLPGNPGHPVWQDEIMNGNLGDVCVVVCRRLPGCCSTMEEYFIIDSVYKHGHAN